MKLFIIVRDDLPAGLQAAQSCHATRQFTADFPALDLAWHTHSNNIVLLQARDLEHLTDLADKLSGECSVARFCEPDLDGQLTAIGVMGETAHRWLSSLPLALRQAA